MKHQASEPIKQTMFGPAAPSLGWVPAPRYILRRNRILRLLRGAPRGKLLEVGCGAGALLSEIASLGFDCSAIETSEKAFGLAREFNPDQASVAIRQDIASDWDNSFDYLLACEVLEHIEDDNSALRQWASWLKPSGRLLLSVPAHQRLWSDDDVWAGHYRRYSREGLITLCKSVGLEVLTVESYGYPLANWIDPIRSRIHGQRIRDESTFVSNKDTNSARSGTERSTEVRLFPVFGRLPGALIMQSFCQLQRIFLQTDLGNGYLVEAQRP